MNNKVNTFYKTTKITTVIKHEDGTKELFESTWVGKHTVKEIKESLPESQTFVSVEYSDERLEFDLETFNNLRAQSLI